jgi:TetR/AcrR family transcriptional repressor of nem operon
MREAGFTHGGFYNHFESKEALAAEACERVFARANASLASRLEPRNATAWSTYVADTLEPERVHAPSDDATLATLAADASREGPKVQHTFAAGIEAMLNTVATYFATRMPSSARIPRRAARTQAVQHLSALVGACVLARAVSRSSPDLSNEILAANAGPKRSGRRSKR